MPTTSNQRGPWDAFQDAYRVVELTLGSLRLMRPDEERLHHLETGVLGALLAMEGAAWRQRDEEGTEQPKHTPELPPVAPKLRELLALLEHLGTVDNTGDAAMLAGDLSDPAYVAELRKVVQRA